MNGAGSQPEIINKLKALKAEVIQTSSGLLVRTSENSAAMGQMLKSVDSSLEAVSVDTAALKNEAETPKDVLAFISHD